MLFDKLIEDYKSSQDIPTLYLVRGLPGSGKTTYVLKKLLVDNPSIKHFEADMYFQQGGDYYFDPSRLKEAHQWCFNQTKEALQGGEDVVVSNTFTQQWEMTKYIELAKTLPATLKVLKATGEYQNVHNVPQASLDNMKKRWQDHEGEETI